MNRCLKNERLATQAAGRCLLGGLVLAAAGPSFGAAARAQDNTGSAVQMVVERTEPGPRCVGEPARPAQLSLQMGKSTVMRLPEPLQKLSVGNPGVVQAMPISLDAMYIAGVDVGTTNLIVQSKNGLCSVIDVVVAMDPSALQATLAAVMPDEKDIKVMAAADTLVLSGTVSDSSAALRAGELAAAYVRRPMRALSSSRKDEGGAAGGQSGTAQSQAANLRVINMLNVSAPQQVQLEVKIAEVSKTLLERLEAGATFHFGSSWGATLLSNFITGNAHGVFDAHNASGNRQLNLQSEKTDGLVRILAEPNVMAISGQEGTFLAGGKFYVPVAQDNNKVTLEEKEFGVGLRFTPTVLSGGRINLHVAPEVSELAREGIGITATGTSNTAVLPLITTRRASTTVQLYDGQSFAIGGLIKNNLVTNLKGMPLLGEVPILGALFRSTDYQQDRTELVFVITAHLVRPLPLSSYTLPTDKVGVPSRAALMLGGRVEGAPPETTTAADSTPAVTATSAQSRGGFELK